MGSFITAISWKVRGLPVYKKEGTRDYHSYHFTAIEECRCFLEGMALTGLLAYFFYRSVAALFILSPILFFYRKEKKKRLAGKRMEELERQFRELLLCVIANIRAGYSVENAFLESLQDVTRLFGASCDMAKELVIIKQGMENGSGLVQLLSQLGNRCPEGEIREFTEVFTVADRTGGKLGEVIKRTADMIREKAEIKEELRTLVHAKQMENRIMCAVPFFILLYIDLTSPGYFNALYHNVAGIFVMTVCMLLYLAALWMADRITRFQIE